MTVSVHFHFSVATFDCLVICPLDAKFIKPILNVIMRLPRTQNSLGRTNHGHTHKHKHTHRCLEARSGKCLSECRDRVLQQLGFFQSGEKLENIFSGCFSRQAGASLREEGEEEERIPRQILKRRELPASAAVCRSFGATSRELSKRLTD